MVRIQPNKNFGSPINFIRFINTLFGALAIALATSNIAAAQGALGDAYRYDAEAAQQRAATSAAATLTAAEKSEILRLVNNARASARVCGTRTYQRAAPLMWKPALEKAAQRHSSDMAARNRFSHTGSDGSSPADRINATGYKWSLFVENIAAGYSTAQAVVNGWLRSPGHCANIMDSRVMDMGAAKAVNPASRYGTYWTYDGARPLLR
jgi:uncharacterized protein YkwD